MLFIIFLLTYIDKLTSYCYSHYAIVELVCEGTIWNIFALYQVQKERIHP